MNGSMLEWRSLSRSSAVAFSAKTRLAASPEGAPWDAAWFPFARDGRGGTLFIDREGGQIVGHRLDPMR